VPAAADHGELLVLAVKGQVAAQVLRAAGADNLAGKPVIDTTNPIADAPADNGGHGGRRGGPGHRAPVHSLVHPCVPGGSE
jgi:predicted dinucleotide-binding enzyme